MLLSILLVPFKLLDFIVGLAVRIILWPIKAVAVGLLLQLAMFLTVIAVLAVLAYVVYQWIT